MDKERALAYVNMFAILGVLPYLCQLDGVAAGLANVNNISLGLKVKDGPAATLIFDKGTCRMVPGCRNVDICLPFSSCRRFNGMIDGTVTPIPSKGFLKIKFLLKNFIKLTDMLNEYLRASKEQLEDDNFFYISTMLMFRLIAQAAVQLGNEDEISRLSVSNMPDGVVRLGISDKYFAYIQVKEHKLSLLTEAPPAITSALDFQNMTIARALFDGEVSSIACVGRGEIRMTGLINQLDNFNRILSRVAAYLA